MIPEDFISRKEQLLRKRWLVASIVFAVYAIITDILFILFSKIGDSSLVFPILLNLITLALLYHFSYKNFDTRLLTFIMFGRLLGLIVMICLIHRLQIVSSIIWSYCISAIDLFVTLGWIYLSFKLKKVNLRMRTLYKV